MFNPTYILELEARENQLATRRQEKQSIRSRVTRLTPRCCHILSKKFTQPHREGHSFLMHYLSCSHDGRPSSVVFGIHPSTSRITRNFLTVVPECFRNHVTEDPPSRTCEFSGLRKTHSLKLKSSALRVSLISFHSNIAGGAMDVDMYHYLLS